MDDTRALLIYDGDCGFCVRSQAWIVARWNGSIPAKSVPSQHLDDAELAELGLSRGQVLKSVWWIEDDRQWAAHRAVAKALIAAEGGWAVLGNMLLVPPLCWLAAPTYRLVARYRSHLHRASSACTR